MPGPRKKISSTQPSAPFPSGSAKTPGAHALLVIDNRPLQRTVWTEFHIARKRLEKTARDLHRHEEVDRPAYDAWLHRTFPVWVTTLRELHAEVSLKSRQVQSTIALAELTGRSIKKLWREQKEYEANPDTFEDNDDASPEDENADTHESFEDEPKQRARGVHRSRHERDTTASITRAAKAIYRRLVQHLHPDRGGNWDHTRKRLWHEVQQAWAAGDADWLARLEVEWETDQPPATGDRRAHCRPPRYRAQTPRVPPLPTLALHALREKAPRAPRPHLREFPARCGNPPAPA
jgi:hypothetical protein